MKLKRFLLPCSKRCLFIPSLFVLVAFWAVILGIRAFILVVNPLGRSAPLNSSTDLPVQEVHFTASDGVHLAGWLAIASPRSPTIILVHGIKGSRVDMLPWAQFLYHAGGYNVLL